MSKSKRTRKNDIGVEAPWLAVSIRLLRSRAVLEISPHAAKLLLLLLSQIGPTGRNNGRLSLTKAELTAAGWKSNATTRAAIHELIEARLLVVTRQGRKGCLALYALSPYAMNCDRQDLEVGPSAWTTRDYCEDPAAARPVTLIDPAVWRQTRRDEKRKATTRHGTASPELCPATGPQSQPQTACGPAAGQSAPLCSANAVPPRASLSREAICPAEVSAATRSPRRRRATEGVPA